MQQDADGCFLEIDPAVYDKTAGFIRILSIVPQNPGSQEIGEFTVNYQAVDSTAPDMAAGARLSCRQKAIVRFRPGLAPVPTIVKVEYMSGIHDLQEYVDGDQGGFPGLDCLIKSAVPATLRIQCGLETEEELTD